MEENEIITENTAIDYENVLKNTNLRLIYENRRKKLYDYMAQNGISAAVFEDSEEKREPALRYLTGHPSDAVLILDSENKRATLIPWDENLASEKANADEIIPYTEYNRENTVAVCETLKKINLTKNCVVSLSPSTSYLQFKKYESLFSDSINNWKIECSEDSIYNAVENFRAQKDEYEIACTRKACAITSNMTEQIISLLQSGKIKTETDVALFIERELRAKGCEKTSFDTLAAGPTRSFAIHAFPGYTAATWGTDGLSILDYGVCFEGYASDCTITIARGNLSKEQNETIQSYKKPKNKKKKKKLKIKLDSSFKTNQTNYKYKTFFASNPLFLFRQD